MLLILLLAINFCCGIELTGSEHVYHKEKHHNVEKHKPLPYVFHPLHFKKIGQVNSHVMSPKQTVTITKTIVTEITKSLYKQPICVKAHPAVPHCHSSQKIQATPVLQTPVHKATKMVGVFEKKKEACHKSHRGREGRHIILPNPAEFFFREFHTVTEILRITKVEHYVDCSVTATLVAENCIPFNEDLPPCPVKVEDYDYPYKPGIEHISIFGKKEIQGRIDEEDEDRTSFSDENTFLNSSLLF